MLPISAINRRLFFFSCSHWRDYQAVGKGLIFFKLEITKVEDIKSKYSCAILFQDELEVSISLIFWNEMSKMPTTYDLKNFSLLQHFGFHLEAGISACPFKQWFRGRNLTPHACNIHFSINLYFLYPPPCHQSSTSQRKCFRLGVKLRSYL